MRVVLLGLLLSLSIPAAVAAPPDLVGLWGNETVSGPLLSGTLTVDGRQAPWRADLGGLSVAVQRDGNTVTFAMPGGQGHFKGRVVDGDIRGFWIQPPGLTLQSAYSTPMVLAHAGAGNVWLGEVQPLPDRVTQYLNVQRTPDGTVEAFLANPEYNLGRGRRYSVHVDNDAVVLTDPKRKGWALNGRYDEETEQLRIDWQGIAVFAFTRRDRNQAPGYYVTTSAGALDTYRQPIPAGDGWKTASLAEVGLRAAPMDEMLQHIHALAAPKPGQPQLHSLLVARHGKLAFEAYFHGYSREDVHDTRSSGKSFASLLVGMAIDHGAKLSPQTLVLSVFPDYKDLTHVDDAKRAITVGQLMSMTSGLACDDNDDDSPGGEDKMQGQQEERDWYRYTLALPMKQAPGADTAVYCSAGINLLGGVVRNATGRPLTDLFRDWIAEPLQMRGYHLNLAPGDDAYLAGGIYMRPRDMLKLGQLYLGGGVWQGKRLVDAKWIAASTERRGTFGPNHDYGYAWHLHTFRVGDHDYGAYAAEGNGGQFVIVVPELDLTVAMTAGSYGEFPTWYPLQDLVAQYIIPAALRGTP